MTVNHILLHDHLLLPEQFKHVHEQNGRMAECHTGLMLADYKYFYM